MTVLDYNKLLGHTAAILNSIAITIPECTP